MFDFIMSIVVYGMVIIGGDLVVVGVVVVYGGWVLCMIGLRFCDGW